MVFSKRNVVLFATSIAKLAAANLVARVSVPDASWCIPGSGLTALSGCSAMNSYVENCKSLSVTKSIVDCYCQQEMLSDFYKYATAFLIASLCSSKLTA